MPRGGSNLSNIGNNDLVLLRQAAKKHDKVKVTAGTKKFEIEGIQVSTVIGADGLSFISIPATSAIYRDGKLITADDEVKAAIKLLKQAGRKSGSSQSRKLAQPELPEELRKQLESFAKQNNSRVIFDPAKGGYKVQKLRTKKAK